MHNEKTEFIQTTCHTLILIMVDLTRRLVNCFKYHSNLFLIPMSIKQQCLLSPFLQIPILLLILDSSISSVLCSKFIECSFGRGFVYVQPLQCTQHSVLLSFPEVILLHSLFPLDSPQRQQSLRCWKIQEDAAFLASFLKYRGQ